MSEGLFGLQVERGVDMPMRDGVLLRAQARRISAISLCWYELARVDKVGKLPTLSRIGVGTCKSCA